MTRKVSAEDIQGIWWVGTERTEPYVFSQLFGNDNPVELDLGCGKGLFLYNQAQIRPDVNFIGIDWSRTFSRLGAGRIARHGLTNVRIIADNAWTLLPKFPDDSFQAIHIYFPDPWWKKRHRKRRLVQPALLPHLQRLLPGDALLSVATDVEEYFGVMKEVFAQCPDFLPQPPPLISEGANDLDFLTHFERKYRRAGKPTFRAQYRRVPK